MDTPRIHVSCPACSATNRFAPSRIADHPVCGKCGAELLDGKPVDATDATFDALVAASTGPVVVDFWAAWCGPCRMMAPAFEQAGRTLNGKALLLKVNSDENPQLSARFGIRSIPTLVRLDQGVERARQAGALPASGIVAFAG